MCSTISTNTSSNMNINMAFLCHMSLFPLNKIINLNPVFLFSRHRWVSGERDRFVFGSKPQNYSTVRLSLCFSMLYIGSSSPLQLHHLPNKYLRDSKSKNDGVFPCLLSRDVEADYMPSTSAIQAQRLVGYFCSHGTLLCLLQECVPGSWLR